MKRILILIIGLFCISKVYADCSTTGLRIFPSGKTIRKKSIFVLEGYAESQKIILELNKKHNIYLKCGNKKIKLLVTEICVGQYNLTQAVLKPETELKAGLEYTIYIDNLPKYEGLYEYNKITQTMERLTYKVVAEEDNEKPQLTSIPIELKKTLVYFGCGPSIHVVFSCPVKDNSDIIVKTSLKDLKSGKESTYYIQPENDKIKVGHSMCSGAFKFDESSNDYEIEFSFMDASGNLTVWNGERIKFSKPTKATDINDE